MTTNKQKKAEFIETIFTKLVEMSRVPDKTTRSKINTLITKLRNETLDFKNAMKYIHHNMVHSRKPQHIAVWANITNTIKEYFNYINTL